MNRLKSLLISGLACLAAPHLAIADLGGRLVIVGGGLRASNQEIHQALMAGLGETGEIGIIPLASGRPVATGLKFKGDLIRHGLSADRIHLLPLAVRDDATTDDVDESEWATNAQDADLAAQIDGLAGLWFTGGDQSRITQTLMPTDEPPSPVLVAVRDLLARGGVIGGTSAGAAMQSEVMILGGTSPYALTGPARQDYPGMESQENGPLVLGPGLGLFPYGTIDQHFERKARLGRLIAALVGSPPNHRIGFGIDEDTALVYDFADQAGAVVGSGTVVMIDARHAKTEGDATTGIRVSVLGAGDHIQFPRRQVTVHDSRKLITSPYLNVPIADVSSLLTPYGGRLEDTLGFLLVDNAATGQVATTVTTPEGATADMIFTIDDHTKGFWGYADGQRDSYSIQNVLVTCRPALPQSP